MLLFRRQTVAYWTTASPAGFLTTPLHVGAFRDKLNVAAVRPDWASPESAATPEESTVTVPILSEFP